MLDRPVGVVDAVALHALVGAGVAPEHYGAVGQQGQGVIPPGSHRCHVGKVISVACRRTNIHHLLGHIVIVVSITHIIFVAPAPPPVVIPVPGKLVGIGPPSVAHLAHGVVTPGPDIPVGIHGVAGVLAGGDLNDAHALGEEDLLGRGVALEDVEILAVSGSGPMLGNLIMITSRPAGRVVMVQVPHDVLADAQLAVDIGAPGPDGAVGLQRQGVVGAGGQHGRGHALVAVNRELEDALGHALAGGVIGPEDHGGLPVVAEAGGPDDPAAVDGIGIHGGHPLVHGLDGHVVGVQKLVGAVDIGAGGVEVLVRGHPELLAVVHAEDPAALGGTGRGADHFHGAAVDGEGGAVDLIGHLGAGAGCGGAQVLQLRAGKDHVALRPVAGEGGHVVGGGGLVDGAQLVIGVVAPGPDIAVLPQSGDVAVTRGEVLHLGEGAGAGGVGVGVVKLLTGHVVGDVGIPAHREHGGIARQHRGGIGGPGAVHVPDAQLALVVDAPGVDAALGIVVAVGLVGGVDVDGQGEILAGKQVGHVVQVDDGTRSVVIALHQPDRVGDHKAGAGVGGDRSAGVGGELAVGIGAPAVILLLLAAAAADGDHGQHMVEAHGGAGHVLDIVAHGVGLALAHLRGRALVELGADAQLAVVVAAPGPQAAVGPDGGAGVAAGGDEDDVLQEVLAQVAHHPAGHHIDAGGVAGGLILGASLAVHVGAPAPDLALQGQSQGVAGAGGDADDLHVLHGARVVGKLDGHVLGHGAVRGARGIAQLAQVVAAPGIDLAALGEGHHVVLTGGDGLHLVGQGLGDGAAHAVAGHDGPGQLAQVGVHGIAAGVHHGRAVGGDVLHPHLLGIGADGDPGGGVVGVGGAARAGGAGGVALAQDAEFVVAPDPDGAVVVQEGGEVVARGGAGHDGVGGLLKVHFQGAEVGAGDQPVLGGVVAVIVVGGRSGGVVVIVVVVPVGGLEADGGLAQLAVVVGVGGVGPAHHQSVGGGGAGDRDGRDLVVGGVGAPDLVGGVQDLVGGIEGKAAVIHHMGILPLDVQLLVGGHDDGGRHGGVGDGTAGDGAAVVRRAVGAVHRGGGVVVPNFGVVHDDGHALPAARLDGVVEPVVGQVTQHADGGLVLGAAGVGGAVGVDAPVPHVAEHTVQMAGVDVGGVGAGAVFIVGADGGAVVVAAGEVDDTLQVVDLGLGGAVAALDHLGSGKVDALTGVVAHLAHVAVAEGPDVAPPSAVVEVDPVVHVHGAEGAVGQARRHLDRPLVAGAGGVGVQGHGVDGQHGHVGGGQGGRILAQLAGGVGAGGVDAVIAARAVVAVGEDGDVVAAHRRVHGPVEELLGGVVIPHAGKGVGLAGGSAAPDLGGGLDVSLVVTVAGLSVGGITPGEDRPVGPQGHGGVLGGVDIHHMAQVIIGVPGGIGAGGGAVDHPDGGGDVVLLVDAGAHAGGVGGVAQLAAAAAAPGVHAALVVQRQGEAPARGHLDDAAEIIAVGGGGGDAGRPHPLGHVHSGGAVSADADLAGLVVAPGVHEPAGGHGHGVLPAGGHGDDVGQVVHAVHRHLIGNGHAGASLHPDGVGSVGGGIVAQLALGAQAPGPDGAVGPQQDGVGVAAHDLGGGHGGGVGVLDEQGDHQGKDLGAVVIGDHGGGLAGAVGLLGGEGVGGARGRHVYNGGIGDRDGELGQVQPTDLHVGGFKGVHALVAAQVEIRQIQGIAHRRHRGRGIALAQDNAAGVGIADVIGGGAVGSVQDEDAVLPDAGADGHLVLGGAGVAHGAHVALTEGVDIAVPADHGGVMIAGSHGIGHGGEVSLLAGVHALAELGGRGQGLVNAGGPGGGGGQALGVADLAVGVLAPGVHQIIGAQDGAGGGGHLQGDGRHMAAIGGDVHDVVQIGHAARGVGHRLGVLGADHRAVGPDPDGQGCGDGAPVTQLAVGVVAPGKDRAVAAQRHGEAVAGGDPGHGGEIGAVVRDPGRGGRGGVHLDLDGGGLGDGGGVAQLAGGVGAPGKDRAVGSQGHGVVLTARDGHQVVHIAAAVVAPQAHGVADIVAGVDAQLAGGVLAPDIGLAVGGEDHGEVIARRSPDGVGDGVGLVVHAPGEDGNSSVHLGLALALQIAQLAVIVAAPGKDPAFHRDGHPVVAAGGDMGDPVVMALLRGEDDLDGHRLAALVVFVATVVVEGQVGAQLAVEVVAPGPHRAVGAQGQGKVPPGGHHGHGHAVVGQHGDQHGAGVDIAHPVILVDDVEGDGGAAEGPGNGLDDQLLQSGVGLDPGGDHLRVGDADEDVLTAVQLGDLGVGKEVEALVVDLVDGIGAVAVAHISLTGAHGDGQRRLTGGRIDQIGLLDGAVGLVVDGMGQLQAAVRQGAHPDRGGTDGLGKVADMFHVVVAPGVHIAGVAHHDAVVVAGGDGLHGGQVLIDLVGGVLDGVLPRQGLDGHGLGGAGVGAAVGDLAHLAHVVGAPGPHLGLGHDDAGRPGHSLGLPPQLGEEQGLGPAGGDVGDVGDGAVAVGLGDGHGQMALGVGAVAQLPGRVVAPGVDGPVAPAAVAVVNIGEGQDMAGAQVDLHHPVQHGGRAVQVSTVSAAAEILLGVGIQRALLLPAPHGDIGGTAVVECAHLDRVGKGFIEDGVVAQLAAAVGAPHPHGTVGAQGGGGAGGGVGAGGGDLDDMGQILPVAHAAAHADQPRGGGVLVQTGVITALAHVGGAPGQDRAVLQKGQGVAVAHGDLHRSGEVAGAGAAVFHPQAGGGIHGVPIGALPRQDPHGMGPVGQGAVAHLSAVVVAPGVHVALGGEGHVVEVGGGTLVHRQGHHGIVVDGVGGAVAVLGLTVAQQAHAVDAKHLHGGVDPAGVVGLGIVVGGALGDTDVHRRAKEGLKVGLVGGGGVLHPHIHHIGAGEGGGGDGAGLAGVPIDRTDRGILERPVLDGLDALAHGEPAGRAGGKAGAPVSGDSDDGQAGIAQAQVGGQARISKGGGEIAGQQHGRQHDAVQALPRRAQAGDDRQAGGVGGGVVEIVVEHGVEIHLRGPARLAGPGGILVGLGGLPDAHLGGQFGQADAQCLQNTGGGPCAQVALQCGHTAGIGCQRGIDRAHVGEDVVTGGHAGQGGVEVRLRGGQGRVQPGPGRVIVGQGGLEGGDVGAGQAVGGVQGPDGVFQRVQGRLFGGHGGIQRVHDGLHDAALHRGLGQHGGHGGQNAGRVAQDSVHPGQSAGDLAAPAQGVDVGKGVDGDAAGGPKLLQSRGVGAAGGLQGRGDVAGGQEVPGKGGEGALLLGIGRALGVGVHAQESGGVVAPGPDGAVHLNGEGDAPPGVDLGVGHPGVPVGIGPLGVDGDLEGSGEAGGGVHRGDGGGAELLLLQIAAPIGGNIMVDPGVAAGQLLHPQDALVAGVPVQVGAGGVGLGHVPLEVEALVGLLHDGAAAHRDLLGPGDLHVDGHGIGGVIDRRLAPGGVGGVVGDIGVAAYRGGDGGGGDPHQVVRLGAHQVGQLRGGSIAVCDGIADMGPTCAGSGVAVVDGDIAHFAHFVAAPAVDVSIGADHITGLFAGGDHQHVGELAIPVPGADTGGDRVALVHHLVLGHAQHSLTVLTIEGDRAQVGGSIIGILLKIQRILVTGMGAVAVLAVGVGAPGVDLSVAAQAVPGVDAGGDAPARHAVRQDHLPGGLDLFVILVDAGGVMPAVVVVPISAVEILEQPIGAPGVDLAVHGQGGAAAVPGGNGLDGQAAAQAVLHIQTGGDRPLEGVLRRDLLDRVIGAGAGNVHVGAVGGVAQAQLVDVVAAPDVHGAVGAQSHGELAARLNGHHVVQILVAAGDVHGGVAVGGRVAPGDMGGQVVVAVARHVVQTQLAVSVGAPGPDRAVGVQSQGVIRAGGHRHDLGHHIARAPVLIQAQGEVDLAGGEGGGAGHHVLLGAPGPDVSGGVHSQGEAVAGGHAHDVLQDAARRLAHGHGGAVGAGDAVPVKDLAAVRAQQGVAHAGGPVGALVAEGAAGRAEVAHLMDQGREGGGGLVAGAQLAGGAQAPGPDGTVRLEGHGMLIAAVHHGGGLVGGPLACRAQGGAGDQAHIDLEHEDVALAVQLGPDHDLGPPRLGASGDCETVGVDGGGGDAPIPHRHAGEGQPRGGRVARVAVHQVEAAEIAGLQITHGDGNSLVAGDPDDLGAQGILGAVHQHLVSQDQSGLILAGADGIHIGIVGAVALLPVASVAGGPDGAVGLEHDGMLDPGAHAADGVEVAGVVGQAGDHVHGGGPGLLGGTGVGAVGGIGRDAQLAVLVLAPGVELAGAGHVAVVLGDGETLVPAGGDAHDHLAPVSVAAQPAVGIGGGAGGVGIGGAPHPEGDIVGRGVHIGPDAQLALAVVAEGVNLGADGQAGLLYPDQDQGMLRTGGDGHHAAGVIVVGLALALEGEDGQAPVGGGAVAQLAVSVAAPGQHPAVDPQGHGVVPTGADGGNAAEVVGIGGALALQHMLGHEGGGHRRGRGALALGAGAGAQLIGAVGAPGVDLAAGVARVAGIRDHLGALGQGQGVAGAGGHGHEEQLVQGGAVIGGGIHLGGKGMIGRPSGAHGIVAQLAQGVVAGGPDVAVHVQHDQMAVAGGDGDDVAQIVLHAVGIAGHHLGGGGVGDEGAVAQLAIGVVAPGPNGAVGAQGGGEALARHHHGGGVGLLLGHGDVDDAGVAGDGVGHPDGHQAVAAAHRFHLGADGVGGDGGHGGLAGDPVERLLSGGQALHQHGAAVHQQVEAGEIDLQQVGPLHPGVLLLVHDHVLGGHGLAGGGIQGVLIALHGAAGGGVVHGDLAGHQSLGLQVAHHGGLGGDEARIGPGAVVAGVDAVGAQFVIVVGAGGVDLAVSPDHQGMAHPGVQGGDALHIGLGGGVEAVALAHELGGLYELHAGGGHAVGGLGGVAGIIPGAQLAVGLIAPGVDVAVVGDGEAAVLAQGDLGPRGQLHRLPAGGVDDLEAGGHGDVAGAGGHAALIFVVGAPDVDAAVAAHRGGLVGPGGDVLHPRQDGGAVAAQGEHVLIDAAVHHGDGALGGIAGIHRLFVGAGHQHPDRGARPVGDLHGSGQGAGGGGATGEHVQGLAGVSARVVSGQSVIGVVAGRGGIRHVVDLGVGGKGGAQLAPAVAAPGVDRAVLQGQIVLLACGHLAHAVKVGAGRGLKVDQVVQGIPAAGPHLAVAVQNDDVPAPDGDLLNSRRQSHLGGLVHQGAVDLAPGPQAARGVQRQGKAVARLGVLHQHGVTHGVGPGDEAGIFEVGGAVAGDGLALVVEAPGVELAVAGDRHGVVPPGGDLGILEGGLVAVSHRDLAGDHLAVGQGDGDGDNGGARLVAGRGEQTVGVNDAHGGVAGGIAHGIAAGEGVAVAVGVEVEAVGVHQGQGGGVQLELLGAGGGVDPQGQGHPLGHVVAHGVDMLHGGGPVGVQHRHLVGLDGQVGGLSRPDGQVAVGVGAVAQLALRAPAHIPHGAVLLIEDAVVGAGGDGDDVFGVAGQRRVVIVAGDHPGGVVLVVHHVVVAVLGGGVAVAQLAGGVPAEGPHGGVGPGQGAGGHQAVTAARGYVLDALHPVHAEAVFIGGDQVGGVILRLGEIAVPAGEGAEPEGVVPLGLHHGEVVAGVQIHHAPEGEMGVRAAVAAVGVAAHGHGPGGGGQSQAVAVLGHVAAQLGPVVAAPGVDGAVALQGHGVVAAGGDGEHVLKAAVDVAGVFEGAGGAGAGKDVLGQAVARVVGGADAAGAQLAVRVAAPGQHMAVGIQGQGEGAAGVVVIGGAGADGDDAVEIGVGGVGLILAAHQHRLGKGGGGVGAVAQLAALVVAPGPHVAVGVQGQGEVGARGHADDIVQGGAVGVLDHLDGHVAAAGGPVAQLAGAVLAPSPHGAVGAQGHGEVPARRGGGGGQLHGDVRGGGLDRVVVLEDGDVDEAVLRRIGGVVAHQDIGLAVGARHRGDQDAAAGQGGHGDVLVAGVHRHVGGVQAAEQGRAAALVGRQGVGVVHVGRVLQPEAGDQLHGHRGQVHREGLSRVHGDVGGLAAGGDAGAGIAAGGQAEGAVEIEGIAVLAAHPGGVVAVHGVAVVGGGGVIAVQAPVIPAAGGVGQVQVAVAAQLAVVVEAPGVDGAVVPDGHGVGVAHGDGHDLVQQAAVQVGVVIVDAIMDAGGLFLHGNGHAGGGVGGADAQEGVHHVGDIIAAHGVHGAQVVGEEGLSGVGRDVGRPARAVVQPGSGHLYRQAGAGGAQAGGGGHLLDVVEAPGPGIALSGGRRGMLRARGGGDGAPQVFVVGQDQAGGPVGGVLAHGAPEDQAGHDLDPGGGGVHRPLAHLAVVVGAPDGHGAVGA